MERDKASLLLNSEPFLTRICRIIDSVASPVIAVSSNKQQLPYLPDGVSVVPDLWKDEGPLAGMLTGLEFIADHSPGSELVWLGSCDAPLVNIQVVTRLSQTSGAWDAVMVQSGAQLQPFSGIYRTCVRHKLQALFDTGERRLHAIANSMNVFRIEAESLRSLDQSWIS